MSDSWPQKESIGFHMNVASLVSANSIASIWIYLFLVCNSSIALSASGVTSSQKNRYHHYLHIYILFIKKQTQHIYFPTGLTAHKRHSWACLSDRLNPKLQTFSVNSKEKWHSFGASVLLGGLATATFC